MLIFNILDLFHNFTLQIYEAYLIFFTENKKFTYICNVWRDCIRNISEVPFFC